MIQNRVKIPLSIAHKVELVHDFGCNSVCFGWSLSVGHPLAH